MSKYEKFMVTGQIQLSKNTPEINRYFELDRPSDS